MLPAEALAFVPVVAAAAEAPSGAGPAGLIEVVLGDAVVRVPPDADGKLLAKVLRAVQALAWSCRADGSPGSWRPGRSTSGIMLGA